MSKGLILVTLVPTVLPFISLVHLSVTASICDIASNRNQSEFINFMCGYCSGIVLSILSQTIPLKAGDLIFTGTPAGVGQLQKGDVVSADLDQPNAISLSFSVT